MIHLIELLESFNRKERYFLIRQAVGGFKLSDEFRRELGNATGLAIPQDAFAAMDYHLDWLTAALHAYERGNDDLPLTIRNVWSEGTKRTSTYSSRSRRAKSTTWSW